jgi:16S rRNA (adenine1518-N6/adenine1519-N6)-dimethyltransferase
VRLIRAQPGELVVEIGPGQGALTFELLKQCQRMLAIELDRDLIGPLQQNAATIGELEVIQADVLEVDFATLLAAQGHEGTKMRVVGNLPYNISTPILFHLAKARSLIIDMNFMFQKEVVDRMAAEPGSKTYGRLSVMSRFFWQVEPLLSIPPGAFFPAPKVHSTFVRLIPHPQPPVEITDFNRFDQIVRAAFGQRRKTLRNALSGIVSDGQFRQAGVDPGFRAERLSLEAFAALSCQTD